ncbi:MAG TPA: neutral zinc metallopeptidase [Candidatus Competibacteraceae bacterium]|nr:neutral zinc metallopeptidase [Candidatus Competibacteraceae bacterium]MCP5132315.1 neutral zinc metallopeptidase [Gammaproteobacteria bacterium]HPF58660.1 neutral zinc metallopeptidase [Candidatus Competibacteraceae bacterium]HRX71887.1 neutral zinc metallopeptidase [Candidatus Competibacteraceae bacterium]
MRWRDLRRSSNIEDRRDEAPSARGGLGGGVKLSGGGLLLVLVASLIFGFNPTEVLNLLSGGPAVSTSQQTRPHQAPSPGDPMADFVSAVLGDTEDVWSQWFRTQGGRYQQPRLVLFRDAVQSACGFASAAVGPFYCPGDQQVYLDLSFFQELSQRFGAPGDFARAYVIAHEIGHHIQNLTGISGKVQAQRQQLPEAQANALSVLVELQADCLAGVWGHHAQQRGVLEPGDVEAALQAATAIGDDRLQQQARGYVTPDSFTHGTSQQRVQWFNRGLKTGNVSECNTFTAQRL